nr:Chain 6, Integrin beta-1 [Homo sapiens]4DX9_7 Chain 7, Integrin beta-1 [Homo sapiens]4DX9_8 Chain 8, Integrin beta-1 [Homo sapiens]4DX9_9 Chain 9, Integrin beta-1 [Homo sapiens]4DX9_B Chain B, Integrin beta-1 [Homo sapiens]4DX9_D Chain D, Integrin beta-1 [Homo sapiens]4DX9_F Chain F, Integrin beta-1 [Homo sapiens]4DX9_H Chain H, Integrin beta-1 [Homo sapiens]4DX9_J Chain J, Integrin beta-1 [Homo sapiens]4DX9_L Chain L, Integrin beta-1 [Homo sapiens]4DX9_N Chain N, Integrin beta-1 [Homo
KSAVTTVVNPKYEGK